MRHFYDFCSVNKPAGSVLTALAVCLFLTLLGGCRSNPCNQGGRDPLVGPTRLPPPATTRRAVFVRNDRGSVGNVIPGGPKVPAGTPVQPTYAAGQNPAPTAQPAPSATGWTAVSPGSGGRVPVSQPSVRHEPDTGAGAYIASGTDTYITRYTPFVGDAASAENVSLQWIPVTGQASAVQGPELKPGNTGEISYARRFPYAKIVPQPLQAGAVQPREEQPPPFFPQLQPPPSVVPYCEQREAQASDAWVRTLDGPYTLELRPAQLALAPAPPVMAQTHPAIGQQSRISLEISETEIRTDCPVPATPPSRPVEPRYLPDDPAVIDLRSLPVADY